MTPREQARQILKDNCHGTYTIPAKDLYPFQWNWDSCFCALGWGTFDEVRAWQEFDTLFSGQWKNGMLPHIIFHKESETYFPNADIWNSQTNPPTSGISQPPVASTLVKFLYERCKDKSEAKKRLHTLLPKLFLYHSWYHTHRCENGLITTYHPWETGRDNSAEWDEALFRVPLKLKGGFERRDTALIEETERPTGKEYDHYVALLQILKSHDYDGQTLHNTIPFKIADIGINSILLRADKDLLWLYQQTGDTKYSDQIKNRISSLENAFDLLWSSECENYGSYDLRTNTIIPVETAASFLPFYAGAVSDDKAEKMLKKLHSWEKQVKFMLPSLDPFHHKFEPKRYWKGPIWPIINFLVATGLKEHGYTDHANRIQEDTRKLIEQEGFREYFNPLNGLGLGGSNFSWAAATYLFWL